MESRDFAIDIDGNIYHDDNGCLVKYGLPEDTHFTNGVISTDKTISTTIRGRRTIMVFEDCVMAFEFRDNTLQWALENQRGVVALGVSVAEGDLGWSALMNLLHFSKFDNIVNPDLIKKLHNYIEKYD